MHEECLLCFIGFTTRKCTLPQETYASSHRPTQDKHRSVGLKGLVPQHNNFVSALPTN